MKQKLFQKCTVLAMALFIIMPLLAMALAVPANAQLSTGNIGVDYAENIGLGNKDPRDMAVSIIQVILGFLAIIVVIIILFGGFKWMTAGGNEDKVAEAKKLISAGIVGLVIILASWGIARFVVSTVLTATQ